MESSDLVPTTSTNAGGHSSHTTVHNKSAPPSPGSKTKTPPPSKNETVGMSLVRQRLESKGVQGRSADVIMCAWRSSTKRHYDTYYKKWVQFCHRRKITPLCPNGDTLLEFLTELYDNGYSYTALNSARSAVSAILFDKEKSIGELPIICKFLRGVFNTRPQMPRYTMTWDVNIVLSFLKLLSPAKCLSLEQLSYKTAALLLLLSSQRGQTILSFQSDNIVFTKNSIIFKIDSLLKTTRPGHHIKTVSFKAFPADRRLCVVTYVKAYLARTAPLRQDKSNAQLLISFRKPHRPIGRDTLARWTRRVMQQAGVDTTQFKPHSTRAASASAAARFVPLQTILDAGGWSKASTFSKFYHKNTQHPALSLNQGVLAATKATSSK